ncbi:acetylxylan esterase [Metabacillus arenae]|uniref:Alpha/beta fold hydrolase n=1 Tax=Metabacillus arenae TaxID=2771434 RepID=A0A926NGU0_9BACI|nr:alpha/beta fold hydrolase [Metabacillus arenae]MBD1381026.1 alpha/beta fold hydrolase [Metabacillus arenae]
MDRYKQTISDFNNYKPMLTKREDFDDFWDSAIQLSNSTPLQETIEQMDYPINEVIVNKVTYQGIDGTPIQAYYLLPSKAPDPLPCLICFHGYGGSKGSPSRYTHWLIQGYAVLAVDARGHGKTGESSVYTTGHAGSWATQGLLDKKEYYYYKVYTDSKRAIDFVMNRPEINHERVGIIGGSFGGGISLAVAALDSRPKLFAADVPNMCNIELAIEQKMEGSLTAIETYLAKNPKYVDKVLETLSYFDNLNLANRIQKKIRISVALKDPVCPPQTIFGVYNHISSEKTLIVHPYAGHDAPGTEEHIDQLIQFVRENL